MFSWITHRIITHPDHSSPYLLPVLFRSPLEMKRLFTLPTCKDIYIWGENCCKKELRKSHTILFTWQKQFNICTRDTICINWLRFIIRGWRERNINLYEHLFYTSHTPHTLLVGFLQEQVLSCKKDTPFLSPTVSSGEKHKPETSRTKNFQVYTPCNPSSV